MELFIEAMDMKKKNENGMCIWSYFAYDLLTLVVLFCLDRLKQIKRDEGKHQILLT